MKTLKHLSGRLPDMKSSGRRVTGQLGHGHGLRRLADSGRPRARRWPPASSAAGGHRDGRTEETDGLCHGARKADDGGRAEATDASALFRNLGIHFFPKEVFWFLLYSMLIRNKAPNLNSRNKAVTSC